MNTTNSITDAAVVASKPNPPSRNDNVTTFTMDSLSDDVFIDYIFPYVGKNQFRFIAGVNHTFYDTYTTVFPTKRTSKHIHCISTISRGILYLQEVGVIRKVSQFKPIRELVIDLAAQHGSMEIVHAFHQYQPYISKIDDTIICARTALIGNFRGVIALRLKKCKWDQYTCSSAALNGHLNIVRYAHINGCPWDSWTCSNAALNGHLSIVEYAHKEGCPWTPHTCSQAALNGHLSIIQYAHKHHCPWNEWTCSNAATNGHLSIVKFAHENGCPWNSFTCSNAAEKGHLPIIEYAHENRCSWSIHTLENASENGHHDIVRYAIMNGCPGSEYFELRMLDEMLNGGAFGGFGDDDDDDDDDDNDDNDMDDEDGRNVFAGIDEAALLRQMFGLQPANRHELQIMTLIMERFLARQMNNRM